PAEEVTVKPLVATPAVSHDWDLPAVFTSASDQVLPAPFAGRIKKLHVTAGTKVKKGDAIATLDTAELSAKLRGARAEEQAARADAGAAATEASKLSREVQIKTKLVKVGVMARFELEVAQKELQTASNRGAGAAARADAAAISRAELERQ